MSVFEPSLLGGAMRTVGFGGSTAASEGAGAPRDHGPTRFVTRVDPTNTSTYFAPRDVPLFRRNDKFSAGLNGGDELLSGSQAVVDAMARITQLAAETATPCWDGEGAPVVRSSQWDAARRILRRAMREVAGLPAPFASACGDGTVHLQWTTARGDRGVVEIGPEETWWSLLPISGEGDQIVALRSPDEALAQILKLFG